MNRRSIQEIKFPSHHDRPIKSVSPKNRMPIARCACGYEILVVPDLKAMNIAINKHVAEHKRAHDGPEKFTEFLTEQVLIVASTMHLSTLN